MKTKNISIMILIGIVFTLLSVNLASAVCTVDLSKSSYSLGATATATLSCDEQTEKNTAYILNWYNQTGFAVHVDTGTTPPVAGTSFNEDFLIYDNYTTSYGSVLTANLTGTDLEGSDQATVAAATASDLIISNFSITSDYYEGKYGAVSFNVIDSLSSSVANAQCIIDIVNGDNLPIVSSGVVVPSQGDGKVFLVVILVKIFLM